MCKAAKDSAFAKLDPMAQPIKRQIKWGQAEFCCSLVNPDSTGE
jgi:hypothetical protein